jgi:hypothetical protein
MRKERHKSGLEKKKKLFRKRNFSSGWELGGLSQYRIFRHYLDARLMCVYSRRKIN